MTLQEYIGHIEFSSYPRVGRFSGSYSGRWNGQLIEAKSKFNSGRSGKGFTTLFYVDGKRIARDKIADAVA